MSQRYAALPLGRSGLRVVDAADGEAEPGEQVAHPLRVAPRQVVVHRDEVRALPGQRVQVERQRGDQRLPLAGGHLRDLALVQHDAADQLHVVGHHVPGLLVPGDRDLRAQQPPARLPHGGVGLGQNLVQRGLQRARVALLGLAQLIRQPRPLFQIRAVVLGPLQAVHLRSQLRGALGDDPPALGGLSLELRIAQVLEPRLVPVNRVDQRADALHLPPEPRPEHLGKQPFDHRSSV